MGNVDGRQTGLIYPNEEIEVYAGLDQSIKLFTGKADTITTDSKGLRFKAFDNLALLKQEFITEEYQSVWRGVDVGVIVRSIVADSKWSPSADFIRTDTGVIAQHLDFRWKSRLDTLKRLVELSNSGEKRYVLYTDGAGVIHFRRYDDDTWPVAFMTTEADLGHVIEDLNGNQTRCLLFFEEFDDIGGTDYVLDHSAYQHDMEVSGTLSIKSKYQTKRFSMDWNDSSSNYGTIGGGSSMDIFDGQSWTIDVLFYPMSISGSGVRLLEGSGGGTQFALIARAASTDIAIDVDGSPSLYEWYPSVGWDIDQWNYLTLVGDGDNVYLYKNGALVDSDSKSPSGNWQGWQSSDVYVGNPSYAVDALIDVVRFNSKAYTTTEIYNYARPQLADITLTEISKVERGGEKFNHCIVKYTDNVWAQYPDPCPENPITKMITTSSERTDHDCYIRAKAIVQSHTKVPTSYKATAYSSRCDYRPNDLVEVYAPRYNIVGLFRLKNMTYTIRDNLRKLSMSLAEQDKELTQLLAIAGL